MIEQRKSWNKKKLRFYTFYSFSTVLFSFPLWFHPRIILHFFWMKLKRTWSLERIEGLNLSVFITTHKKHWLFLDLSFWFSRKTSQNLTYCISSFVLLSDLWTRTIFSIFTYQNTPYKHIEQASISFTCNLFHRFYWPYLQFFF